MSKLIAGILLEGMKIWSTERRLSFQNKHYDVLKRVLDAENDQFPIYTDAELQLAQQEEEIFLQAYHKEMISHRQESENENS